MPSRRSGATTQLLLDFQTDRADELAPGPAPHPPGASPRASRRRRHLPRKSQWGKGGRVGASEGRGIGIITRPGGVCL